MIRQHKHLITLSFLLFSLLLLLRLPVHVFAEGKVTWRLSFDEALNQAFQMNRQLQQLRQEIVAANAAVHNARSGFFPKVDLIAGYTHNDAVIDFSQFPAGTQKKDFGIFTGYIDENMLGLTLLQPIFLGGRNRAYYQRASLSLEMAKELLRSGRLSVAFEVKRLYYGVLLAEETEKIARELYSLAEAHYEVVKEKYDQGTVSRFELLQSKVQVSKTSPAVVKAHNTRRLIEAQLKKILALDIQTDIELTDPFNYKVRLIDEEQFFTEALRQRPELIMKELGVDISSKVITIARSASLPQVNATANYFFKSDDLDTMFNEDHNNWNVGIQIRIPLFDGFSAKAKTEEAKARYEQALLAAQDMREEVALEIRRACLDLEKAISIIKSQEAGVEEAAEALSIAEVSYASGVITNLDVLDAQVSLGAIKQNLSEVIYDYIMASAYLDRVTGKSVGEEKGHEKTGTDNPANTDHSRIGDIHRH